MPAGLPGSQGIRFDPAFPFLPNPSAGRFVIFDLLSGPRASLFDGDVYNGDNNERNDAQLEQCSTGALSTGIGFGSPPIIGPTAPKSINDAGFTDDYVPGVTKPDGTAGFSWMMYIGGGRCNPPPENGDGTAEPDPWTTNFGIGGAGNAGSRDAGNGQGFTMKTVTAPSDIANGVAIETGFTNRSGQTVRTGHSAFGSSTVASGIALP